MGIDKNAMLARIAKAAGAREAREVAKANRPKRRMAKQGERLSCGCEREIDVQRFAVDWCRCHGLTPVWVRNDDTQYLGNNLVEWRKAHGLVAGFPDLLILEPPPNYPGHHAAIELKSECKKHRTSPRQERVHAHMGSRFWCVGVCHGPRGFVEFMAEMGWR